MRVIDGLNRLRHHAIIGGHDQHHDIGCLRAARPHARKRFVTRRIQKHNLAPVRRRFLIGNANFVRANVLRDAASFAFGNAGQANRIEQRGLAVIDVAHDRDHRRTRRDFDRGFFAAASGRVNVFRSLLFERDHVRFGTEEARHFARQFGIERLVYGSENTAPEQARDQILHANVELLRQIFNADAFRDRDIARDRHRLIRHHHARRRRVALHRAFFYATRNIALAGPARGSTRTAAGTNRSRRRKPRTYTERTRTRGSLARGMHRTAFAGTQRTRRTSAGHLRTRTLKNWLPWHGTPGRGTHRSSRRTGLQLSNWRDRPRRRSLVHRARPSLRNNHARRWRLRRTNHCRRRGRTRRGNRRLRRSGCRARRRGRHYRRWRN